MKRQNPILLLENIRPLIHTVRNQQIMLDSDLAEIYGVELRR
ncbi:MAG: ORF6N domain-containing protein, partial [Opitutales bacterium]